VCGQADWRYEQDGKQFDSQGREIVGEEPDSTIVPELAGDEPKADQRNKAKRR